MINMKLVIYIAIMYEISIFDSYVMAVAQLN